MATTPIYMLKDVNQDIIDRDIRSSVTREPLDNIADKKAEAARIYSGLAYSMEEIEWLDATLDTVCATNEQNHGIHMAHDNPAKNMFVRSSLTTHRSKGKFRFYFWATFDPTHLIRLKGTNRRMINSIVQCVW